MQTLASQRREQWVKPVLLRLVRTGEGTRDTRQRQRKSDLLEMGKDAVERNAICSQRHFINVLCYNYQRTTIEG